MAIQDGIKMANYNGGRGRGREIRAGGRRRSGRAAEFSLTIEKYFH
jgi:hypothetical protein